MSEIEYHTQAALVRVFLHYPPFDISGRLDERFEFFGAEWTGKHFHGLSVQAFAVVYDERLEHFRRSGPEFAYRKGGEHPGVYFGAQGHVECANHIFVRVQIDSRLASYRGINHCEQGRRVVDIANASLVECCRHPDHIGGDSSSHCIKHCTAVGSL